MEINSQIIFLLLGAVLNPTFASYANEEHSDTSKVILNSVNSILEDKETSHKRHVNTYDSPVRDVQAKLLNTPTTASTARNYPCASVARCMNPPHGNSIADGAGHNIFEQPSNTLDLQYPGIRNSGNSVQQYPPPYPQQFLPQDYYPLLQIDPGFARFPSPQQGGPMPPFFPPSHNNYNQPPQWLYNQPAGIFDRYHGQQYPQANLHELNRHHPNHQHSVGVECTEAAHREPSFPGDNNHLGYGVTYNAAQNRPGY